MRTIRHGIEGEPLMGLGPGPRAIGGFQDNHVSAPYKGLGKPVSVVYRVGLGEWSKHRCCAPRYLSGMAKRPNEQGACR